MPCKIAVEVRGGIPLIAVSRIDEPTPKPDVKHYLGGYAWGILSPAEERRLHEAALDDQDLFNALAHEHLFREALEDEEFRSRLKRRLRELNERPGRVFQLGFSDWFKRPAVSFAAVAATLILAVGLYRLSEMRSPGPEGDGDDSAAVLIAPKSLEPAPQSTSRVEGDGESLERLWDRARIEPDAISLELDRPGQIPRYVEGEPLQISFSLAQDAAVLLLARDREGIVRQIFPNEYQSSPLVCANQRFVVPQAGLDHWLFAAKTGRHRLRLLVFPAGSDPLEPGSGGLNRPQAAELQYQVLEQQERPQ